MDHPLRHACRRLLGLRVRQVCLPLEICRTTPGAAPRVRPPLPHQREGHDGDLRVGVAAVPHAPHGPRQGVAHQGQRHPPGRALPVPAQPPVPEAAADNLGHDLQVLDRRDDGAGHGGGGRERALGPPLPQAPEEEEDPDQDGHLARGLRAGQHLRHAAALGALRQAGGAAGGGGGHQGAEGQVAHPAGLARQGLPVARGAPDPEGVRVLLPGADARGGARQRVQRLPARQLRRQGPHHHGELHHGSAAYAARPRTRGRALEPVQVPLGLAAPGGLRLPEGAGAGQAAAPAGHIREAEQRREVGVAARAVPCRMGLCEPRRREHRRVPAGTGLGHRAGLALTRALRGAGPELP
mmetsp:Transcript_41962/g.118663  ORF Transcript_41962/g.118663 Transcript_41962/m.118663 type:complete len:353 (+) Transcript_41962:701-1759(+)